MWRLLWLIALPRASGWIVRKLMDRLKVERAQTERLLRVYDEREHAFEKEHMKAWIDRRYFEAKKQCLQEEIARLDARILVEYEFTEGASSEAGAAGRCSHAARSAGLSAPSPTDLCREQHTGSPGGETSVGSGAADPGLAPGDAELPGAVERNE